MPFEFEELGLGVFFDKAKVFPDNRGYFKEIFKESDFKNVDPYPITS
jgi:dTDP-4-dehydrorhamnose 3,5-epimerase